MNPIKIILFNCLQSPYARLMRIDKPTGFMLLLFPVLWSILLASTKIMTAIINIPIFILGSFIMRSAGCIINDLIDKESDKYVSRTKIRPLASGEIKVQNALALLCILLISASALLLALPFQAKICCVVALVLTIIYPMMKYVTYFAQIILGLVFNMGVIIAWITITEQFNFVPIIIYIAAVFWTIGYDTIYALQDRKEDEALGLKSLAIKLKKNAPLTIKQAYICMIILLVLAGLNLHVNIFYYPILAVALFHLNWQAETLEIDNTKNCNERFNSNTEVGFIIMIAVLIGKI